MSYKLISKPRLGYQYYLKNEFALFESISAWIIFMAFMFYEQIKLMHQVPWFSFKHHNLNHQNHLQGF